MEIVYEIEVKDQDIESKNIIAIDLGVNNLATITNNIGLNPIIINGKWIKSINQFYNKRIAKEKSSLKLRNNKNWSNKLSAITFKRYQRIKNYMHNATTYIIKWCIKMILIQLWLEKIKSGNKKRKICRTLYIFHMRCLLSN